jgi:tetratricopeptide (TPR) repeat protein
MEMELLHSSLVGRRVSVTIPIRLKSVSAIFQFLVLEILLATGWQLNGQLMTKEDLEREITTYQVAFQQAKTPDMTGVQAGRIWLHFGALYQDAGMYGQSEQAFEQALRLLAVAPVSTPDLAMAIDSLGTLYMETGNVKEAERAESKALKMREEAGLTSEFPRSWYHLATLYLREHQPAKATNFAERAVNAFLADPSAVPEDKLGSQLVLASALCQSHQYAEAIEKLRRAVQMAKQTYGPGTLPTGFSSFLLGYAFWKSGDLSSAGGLMQDGAEIMGKTLGWKHPGYLLVMTRYAQFLRKQHRQDVARPIEQQVKRMRAQLSANPVYGHGLQTMNVTALF